MEIGAFFTHIWIDKKNSWKNEKIQVHENTTLYVQKKEILGYYTKKNVWTDNTVLLSCRRTILNIKDCRIWATFETLGYYETNRTNKPHSGKNEMEKDTEQKTRWIQNNGRQDRIQEKEKNRASKGIAK